MCVLQPQYLFVLTLEYLRAAATCLLRYSFIPEVQDASELKIIHGFGELVGVGDLGRKGQQRLYEDLMLHAGPVNENRSNEVDLVIGQLWIPQMSNPLRAHGDGCSDA